MAGWIALGSIALAGAGYAACFLTRDSSSNPEANATDALTAASATDSSASSAPASTPPASEPPDSPAPITETETPAEPGTPTSSPAPSTSAPSATSTAPSITVPTETTIVGGTYNAVTEIEPGTYRVLPDPDGDPLISVTVYDGPTEGNIVDVYGAYDAPVVMIVPDDATYRFDFVGLAVDVNSTGPVDPFQYDNGRFIVGFDLQPGDYSVSGEYAYWAIYDADMNRIDRELGTGSPEDVLSFTIPDNAYVAEFSGQLSQAN